MKRFVMLIILALACGRVQEAHRARIGLVTGLTGPTAAWGEAIRRGAEMAAEERGADLVIEDHHGDPVQTTYAVQKLITADHVSAIVGADTSGQTLAASPICERAGVAIVSPTASAPQVTRGRRFTFRVCATDDHEALAASRLAVERLHAKRAAIVRDTRNDYSVGMARTFADAFTRAGGTVAGTFDYNEGDSEFRAQLTSARATTPDVLFVPGYYGDVAQIAIQARDLGITVPLLGGSGWDSPKLTEIGGRAVEGCWFVSGLRSASPKFVEAFRKRYGALPDAASAQAYDAVSLVAEAIRRAGDDPKKVRDAIAATHDFPGASGTITIGPDNNAKKPLAVFVVMGGRFVEKAEMQPGP